MASNLESKISRIATNVRNAIAKVAEKGVAVPAGAKSDNLPELIADIPTGVQLPTLTNPASATDLSLGKELIDADGNMVTGTLPEAVVGTNIISAAERMSMGDLFVMQGVYYTSQIGNNTVGCILRPGANLIVRTPAEDLGNAEAADVVKGKTFTSAAGLRVEGTKVDVEIPVVEQATPTISVDSRGKITASATQEAGQVAAGTKSATMQLTTQAAKTYTPGTSDQTIDPGTYLIGYQTIKGDSNLKAENIRSGVSIFGVEGGLETYDGTVI